jgi:DNA primase
MGRITLDTLERIKEGLPVSAVVSRRVQLKRAGRELRGLSPFNKERTPSFFCNDHKGFWHCFSSGKHGNIFDFLMEMEGLTFVEAVEELAQRAGVEVNRDGFTQETKQASRARKWVGSALACAQAFFCEHLESNEAARAYLRERGIRQRVARDLGIGWAPESSRLLIEHLTDQGFSVADIIEAGLANQPDDPNRTPYAFFRNRLTFPIFGRKHDAADVLSFGARTITGEDPKYLNGRETPFFDKGCTLYNLSRARSAIMEAGVAIVLEGYLDVATVSQEGVHNVVAPLGTAVTVEHLHALWRIAPQPPTPLQRGLLCFALWLAAAEYQRPRSPV